MRWCPFPEATALVRLSLTLPHVTASTWTWIPVCLVKSCIKEVKLALSSIVQTCRGPLSAVLEEVLLPPPQPATHKTTANMPNADTGLGIAPFIEPPPR